MLLPRESYNLGMKVAVSVPERVTEAMNAVIDEIGQEADGFSRAASRRIIERVEWCAAAPSSGCIPE